MKDNSDNLLCKIGFHKWKRHSPKFVDLNHYWAMQFSPYSGSNQFYQFRQQCERCKNQRIILEEVVTQFDFPRYNRIKIPRFTTQEGIDYDVRLSLTTTDRNCLS